MKNLKRIISCSLSAAVISSVLPYAVALAEDKVISSWDFESADVGDYSTAATDTDMYAVVNGGGISIVNDFPENNTGNNAADPSGKVLRLDAEDLNGQSTYLELPKSLLFDDNGDGTYSLKDTFTLSYDMYACTNGWRYGFFAGNSSNSGICYIPNNPDTRTRVLSNGVLIDSEAVNLNEWHHIDIVKTVTIENKPVIKVYVDGKVNSVTEYFDFSNAEVFARIGYSPYGDYGADFYLDNISVIDTDKYVGVKKDEYTLTALTGEQGLCTDDIQGAEVKSDATYHRIYIKSDNIENLTSVALSWGTHYYEVDTMHMDVYASTDDFDSKEALKNADMSKYTKLGETWFRKSNTWGYYYPEVTISDVVSKENTGIIIDLYVIGDNTTEPYVSTIYQKTIGLYYADEEIDNKVEYVGEITKLIGDSTEADKDSVGFVGSANITGSANIGFTVTAEGNDGESYTAEWKYPTVITSETGESTSVTFGLVITELSQLGIDRDNVSAAYLQ